MNRRSAMALAQRLDTGVSLRLIGPLAASQGEGGLDLPRSKKARALLAYLAANRKPQRRDHLCALLWGEAEDAREGLRWCLSRLRKALEADEQTRIETDGDTIALVPEAIDCDLWTLQGIARLTPALARTPDLLRAAHLIDGEFLEGLELPECFEFRIWCAAERENLRRLQGAILAQLCDRLGAADAALPFARRRVLIEPTDEDAHLGLLTLLVSLDRLPEAEQHVATARQQFESAGMAPPHRLIRLWAAQRGAKVQPAAAARPEKPVRQCVRFCTAPDGVRIAYAVSGQGPRIVKAANWYSHLEHDLTSPIWQHLINALAEGRQLVRYDRRGCGLSDWAVGDFGFEKSIADLEAVTDGLGGPFDLVGFCSGGGTAIAYAARHPERVRRLILIGSTPMGFRKRSAAARATNEHMIALTRQGWGLENPAFRQIFTSLMFPDATAEQSRWLNELQRISASPENAARLMDAQGDFDVTDLLPLVRCPTLVLHSRDDAMVSVDHGRQCAAGIPQAQFISLPSRNHLILEDEPAWAALKGEIAAFLSA